MPAGREPRIVKATSKQTVCIVRTEAVVFIRSKSRKHGEHSSDNGADNGATSIS